MQVNLLQILMLNLMQTAGCTNGFLLQSTE